MLGTPAPDGWAEPLTGRWPEPGPYGRHIAEPLLDTLELRTDAGCGLAIGPWPRFRYDASGGGGTGVAGETSADGWQPLHFDPAGLTIPALNGRTGRILGVPLPPGIAIAIRPQQLAGRWQPETGRVELAFEARFQLLLAGRSVAPDLQVVTQLGTGEANWQRGPVAGRPLDAEGRGVLVGVALVPPTGEGWLDRFLGLPGEALAVLCCQLKVLPREAGDQRAG
ncbi:hypothetical protein NZK32_03470 [Cyanobium sp. FGCU-52]|nr:hypothetical protein [Cyanobium sp. FGCU52]